MEYPISGPVLIFNAGSFPRGVRRSGRRCRLAYDELLVFLFTAERTAGRSSGIAVSPFLAALPRKSGDREMLNVVGAVSCLPWTRNGQPTLVPHAAGHSAPKNPGVRCRRARESDSLIPNWANVYCESLNPRTRSLFGSLAFRPLENRLCDLAEGFILLTGRLMSAVLESDVLRRIFTISLAMTSRSAKPFTVRWSTSAPPHAARSPGHLRRDGEPAPVQRSSTGTNLPVERSM